jgi:hypothetical protein
MGNILLRRTHAGKDEDVPHDVTRGDGERHAHQMLVGGPRVGRTISFMIYKHF